MTLAIGIPFGVSFGAPTSRPAFAVAGATFAVDFIQQLMWVENTAGQGVLRSVASGTTFSRASNATYFNSSGVLTTAGANVLRYDHNPTTLAPLGALIEGTRTNGIRNPRCEGASAPSTAPTYWTVAAEGSGLTVAIVGTTVENGIPCLDVDVSGTAVAAQYVFFTPDTPTAIVAADGQTWSVSVYPRIVSGTPPGGATRFRWIEATSGGTSVTQVGANVSAPTTASLTSQRVSATRTLSGGGTVARVIARYEISVAAGQTVSFRLRIGGFQLEQGAFSSSLMLPPVSSPAATTRAADILTATVGGWYTAATGTMMPTYSIYGYTAGVSSVAVELDDGSNNNRYFVAANIATNNTIRAWAVSGGANQVQISLGSPVLNQVEAVAYAYQTDNFSASRNGAAPVTDTTGTLPASITTLRFGTDSANAVPMFGWLQGFVYIPRRLTSAELQALSA